MKQWAKRLASAFLASVLTVSLNGRAYAEIEADPVPETPPQISQPAAATDAPAATTDTPAAATDTPAAATDAPAAATDAPAATTDTLAATTVASAADAAVMLDAAPEEAAAEAAALRATIASVPAPAAAGATSAGSGAAADEGKSETDPLLIVGEEEVDLTNGGSGAGWSYDAAEGAIFLKNFDGSDQIVGTAGKDLTIKNSGLNRIGSLIVDGDLTLVGSGILLVDSIELAQDKNFNFQTNTTIYPKGTGSVAVFLKQVEETTDAEGNVTENVYYKLINGEGEANVTGILDENCTIPEGVTLVVPDGSSLRLQSLTKETSYTYENGELTETVSYSTQENQRISSSFDTWVSGTAPQLTISETARLVVEASASLLFGPIHTVGEQTFLGSTTNTVNDYKPSIRVLGELILNAAVEKGYLRIENTGSYEGAGTLTDSTVVVSGGREDALDPIAVKDSVVVLKADDANLSELQVSGNSTLVYTGDSEIGNLRMDGGSSLTVETTKKYGYEDVLSIGGELSASGKKADVSVLSGILELAEGSTVSNVQLDNQTPMSEIVSQVYGIPRDKDGNATTTGTILGKDSTSANTGNTIPVDLTTYYDSPDTEAGNGALESYLISSTPMKSISRNSNGQIKSVTFDALLDAASDEDNAHIPQAAILEVRGSDGRISYVTLKSGSTESVSLEGVTKIHMIARAPGPLQGGGGTATTTTSVYTGNGNHGQNAGSIIGAGNAKLFSGSGIKNPLSHKAPEPSEDPSDPSDPGDPGTAAGKTETAPANETGAGPQTIAVWVETRDDGDRYELCASEGEKNLQDLGGRASVSMPYVLPAQDADKALYVVFRNADGTLTALRARYSRVKSELRFEADRLGLFVVVAFDFEGEEFSEAFYAALEELPALQRLV